MRCVGTHNEKYIDGLEEVIEIGASQHNGFGLEGKVGRYRNIDYTDQLEQFKLQELEYNETCAPVHIVADMGSLPLPDASVDAYVSSHTLEHTWDVRGALMEAVRVLRAVKAGERGGIMLLVIPHPDFCPDDTDEPETLIVELAARQDWARWHDRPSDGGPNRWLYQGKPPEDYLAGNRSKHRSFWRPETFYNSVVKYLIDAAANPTREHYNIDPSRIVVLERQDKETKVGNGHLWVLQKQVID